MTYVELKNSSSEPVYQVVVSLVIYQGAGYRTGKERSEAHKNEGDPYQRTLLEIPPGRSRTYVPGGWAGMSKRAGIEIAFTDQAGRSWLRYSNGYLQPITTEPIAYYGLSLPQESRRPKRPHTDRAHEQAPAAKPWSAGTEILRALSGVPMPKPSD